MKKAERLELEQAICEDFVQLFLADLDWREYADEIMYGIVPDASIFIGKYRKR